MLTLKFRSWEPWAAPYWLLSEAALIASSFQMKHAGLFRIVRWLWYYIASLRVLSFGGEVSRIKSVLPYIPRKTAGTVPAFLFFYNTLPAPYQPKLDAKSEMD